MEESKIMVTLLKSGIATVWNKNDVMRLRQELRIPGTLAGSLPRKPWQNQVMSLPLLLMPEEVSLLLHKGFAYLGSKDISMHSDSKQIGQDFRTQRDASHFDQIQLFVKEREKKQMRFRNDPDSKGLKKGDNCSGELGNQEMPIKETNVESVSASDMQYYSKATWIHLPTAIDHDSLLSQSVLNDVATITWKFPFSAADKSKYAVFCNLWERGFYITNGAKFGSDYLLYPGEPSSYHSHYIVKIISSAEYCTPHQLLAYGRLASAVKKTFVLAIVNQDDFSVKYHSISWASME